VSSFGGRPSAELIHQPPRRVLAIYAHPDDPDVSCGGTLAAWAAAGTEIHVCLCTDGDKGSADPGTDPAELARRRRHEAAQAAQVLGVHQQHWLGLRDGEMDDAADLRGRLVALVRRLQPDLVMAADPTAVFFGNRYVNHRDHRQTGWAALDAVSPDAGSPLYHPDLGPAHKVSMLLLSGTLEPDAWVDVSATIEAKVAAVACHVTQVGEAGEWLGVVVRQRAEEAGAQAGVAFAEAYRRVLLA
jgi:LmbE family N-acetylglucosaminyl deacetylase